MKALAWSFVFAVMTVSVVVGVVVGGAWIIGTLGFGWGMAAISVLLLTALNFSVANAKDDGGW